MTVNKSFYPQPPESRGTHSSDKEADMWAALNHDLSNVIAAVNANEISIADANKLLFSEFMNARNIAKRQLEWVKEQNYLAAVLGNDIHSLISFRTFAGPDWYVGFSGMAVARRARVEPMYGQVLLPFNNIRSMMYVIDPETDEPIIPASLDYVVTPEDDSGAHDVVLGTVMNAFNGQNRDYWIRRVRFPLESDVSSIAVTLDVTLPSSNVAYANLLSLHPYPLGQLDVEEVKYSIDSSDPSIDLTGFSVVKAAGFLRWHFPDIQMTKLRIKLRQSNFVEEGGYKVFYLGAQEISLQLVGFDKTVGQSQPTDNNGLIVVLEAPTGYKFSTLKRLYTLPSYSTGLSDTGILVKIYSDEALTNKVWDSFTDPVLSVTPVDVSSEATDKLYMVVNLSFLTTEGLSPVLDNIVVSYDTY